MNKFGKLIKPSEVAIELKVKKGMIYRLAKGGFFISLKIGSSLRIYSKSVFHFKECKSKGIRPPQYFI
jgi:hypothetical protein